MKIFLRATCGVQPRSWVAHAVLMGVGILLLAGNAYAQSAAEEGEEEAGVEVGVEIRGVGEGASGGGSSAGCPGCRIGLSPSQKAKAEASPEDTTPDEKGVKGAVDDLDAKMAETAAKLDRLLATSPSPEPVERAPSAGVPSGYYISGELHGSLLTDAADRSLLSGTFGYGAKVGRRWSGWGTYLQMEQNLWISTELDGKVVQGAYNIGLGGELIFANGFVRTAAAAGPSILAFDTALDQAGSVGFFFDFHPLGLRWPMTDTILLGLDPLCFAMVAPVLDGIPLLNVEYRTSFYLEGLF